MTHRRTTIERAYELARSGECATISEIKLRLKAERYDDIAGQLYGRAMVAALRSLCEAARRESASVQVIARPAGSA